MRLLNPYVTLNFSVKINRVLRQRLFSVGALFLIASAPSWAAPLPEIEAHQFQSTPVRTSKSGRVYLFRTDSNDLPRTGNLVLIHDHNKPAMAFRVLKTDADQSEYVGKRVRRYDQTSELKIGDRYFTIEKVSDLLAQPPAEPIVSPTPSPIPLPVMTPVPAIEAPAADDAELDSQPVENDVKPEKHKETNLEVFDYDDELDGSTSPRNLKNEQTDGDQPAQDESGYEIEEVVRLDPLKNMIGFHAGYFKNMSNFAFKGGTHSAINLSYTRTLKNDIWMRGRSPQDAFAVEFGLGYYSRINMDEHNDLYKVVPLFAELHYNLNFTQAFAVYLYAGIEYNSLLSTENVDVKLYPGDADTISHIRGIQHTFGAGILYNMGPQWYLRFNLGWDRITAGLAVKW
jgi:hypothetical protein